MKALALVAALSLTLSLAANAQDSKQSLKSNGVRKQGSEAAATIDVGAIQKKIDAYTDAIKDEPKNDRYYGARGQLNMMAGKFDKAIKDLTTAISLNPRRSAYFEVRGDVYAKANKARDAFEDYSKALKVGTPSHYLYLHQASAAVLMDDYKSAEAPAKSALELQPKDVKTLSLIGGIERELGKLQESLQYLNTAISLDPTNAYLLKSRADTYIKLGRKDLANTDLNLSKKLDITGR